MAKVIRKFEDHLDTIKSAVSGEADLRDNYKLYSKLYKFYTKEGVRFTGDTNIDYNMILNYLYEDLYTETY